MILDIGCILKYFFHFLFRPETMINTGVYYIFVKKMKNIFIFFERFSN